MLLLVCLPRLLISIHAPSRERPLGIYLRSKRHEFQSTLPRGSDFLAVAAFKTTSISIHAPSRERQPFYFQSQKSEQFQSTLPRGSDVLLGRPMASQSNFNPRSLAGATNWLCSEVQRYNISIHAPSRERRLAEPSRL